MTKPFRCYIKDAVIVKINDDNAFVYGKPINDTRFAGWVRTSKIVEIRKCVDYFEIETLNSIYRSDADELEVISVSDFMQKTSMTIKTYPDY